MIIIRADIIKTKLKLIEESIDLVRENLPADVKEFKNLGIIKHGIYKNIESSIQEIINVCAIINSDLNFGVPSNRDEIIIALMKNGVISSKLGKKVKELKGFRNFLVHRYGKIDDVIAFKDINEGLADFRLFKEEILLFLKKHNENGEN